MVAKRRGGAVAATLWDPCRWKRRAFSKLRFPAKGDSWKSSFHGPWCYVGAWAAPMKIPSAGGVAARGSRRGPFPATLQPTRLEDPCLQGDPEQSSDCQRPGV